MTPQLSAKRVERETAQPAPAVVLRFPTGNKAAPVSVGVRAGVTPSGVIPAAPECGERPCAHHFGLREWLRITVIVSLLVHLAAYVAFQLSFESDLERAAGAAAAAASDGTITIPVEVVVEATLPAAPTPVNANAADSEKAVPQTEPTVSEIAKLMPPPPEPAPVKLPEAKIDMPPPPEPAPVVLPTQKQAMELALPEEATAKPVEAKTAAIPEAPAFEQPDDTPPMPQPRRAPPKREKREEKKEAERPSPQKSAPSRAASPSRAAAADSPGQSGAGGRADVGGRAAISSYFARVQAHLSRQVYPTEARASGVSGVVRVVFSLGRDGRVLSVSLAQSSGKSVLDQAALAVVRAAAPFPPFPSDIRESRLELGAPIRFDLR
ncbi:MAG TPA: TonB family protein [Xanthobacteraceae bacterium]|nr:TonB family protein [Xanthobacteraceae bacterium]